MYTLKAMASSCMHGNQFQYKARQLASRDQSTVLQIATLS